VATTQEWGRAVASKRTTANRLQDEAKQRLKESEELRAQAEAAPEAEKLELLAKAQAQAVAAKELSESASSLVKRRK
jgi:hypothetical protein